ncbi:MAG: hypothetical protein HQK83_04480 [Fibrobacteria bacterium]|nr:hypothetical protein [Fibrobacteria bacterium]
MPALKGSPLLDSLSAEDIMALDFAKLDSIAQYENEDGAKAKHMINQVKLSGLKNPVKIFFSGDDRVNYAGVKGVLTKKAYGSSMKILTDLYLTQLRCSHPATWKTHLIIKGIEPQWLFNKKKLHLIHQVRGQALINYLDHADLTLSYDRIEDFAKKKLGSVNNGGVQTARNIITYVKEKKLKNPSDVYVFGNGKHFKILYINKSGEFIIKDGERMEALFFWVMPGIKNRSFNSRLSTKRNRNRTAKIYRKLNKKRSLNAFLKKVPNQSAKIMELAVNADLVVPYHGLEESAKQKNEKGKVSQNLMKRIKRNGIAWPTAILIHYLDNSALAHGYFTNGKEISSGMLTPLVISNLEEICKQAECDLR